MSLKFTGVDGEFVAYYPSGNNIAVSGLFMVEPYGDPHGDLPTVRTTDGQALILDPRAYVIGSELFYNPRKNRNAPDWAKRWLKENPTWGHGITA